jgi:hypothetical protein
VNRQTAALRLWKEARTAGPIDDQLLIYREILQRLSALSDDSDLNQLTEVVIRLRAFLQGVSFQEALGHVVRAAKQGMDPSLLEDSLRLVMQNNSGFPRADALRLVFQYTTTQLKNARALWETLPLNDRTSVTADTLLRAGLEDSFEVVAMVLQEVQSLAGPGLHAAVLLRQAAEPSVAFELWRVMRRAGPIQPVDVELLEKCVRTVGLRADVTADDVESFN